MTAISNHSDKKVRKSLADQIDRLDSILDGLDTALAGAVQEAVSLAVKEAVQAVLAEVLTSRELHEQLQQAAQPIPPEQPGGKNKPGRLCQVAAERLERTMQAVKQTGRRVVLALLAAGGVVVGTMYAARSKIVALASSVHSGGRRLLGAAVLALTNRLPSLALGCT